jgi:hypothetical protein
VGTAPLGCPAGKARRFRGTRPTLPPLAIMGCGLGVLNGLSFRGQRYRRGISCQPAARNHRPKVLFPVGPRVSKPCATGSASTPTGQDSSREIREYIPDFSNCRNHNLIPGSMQSQDCRSEIILLQNRVAQNTRPINHHTLFPNRPPGIFQFWKLFVFCNFKINLQREIQPRLLCQPF